MADLKIRVLRTRKLFWGPHVYYIRSALNRELCPFVLNNKKKRKLMWPKNTKQTKRSQI